MKHASRVSSPIVRVANVIGRGPLLGRSLVSRALLLCLAACGSAEQQGDGAGSGAPAMAASGAETPAPEGNASENGAPGEAPPENAAAAPPSNTAPNTPAPSNTAPGTPAPNNPAPSEGASPSLPISPPGEATPSQPTAGDDPTPSGSDVGTATGDGAGGTSGSGAPQTCNATGAASAATPGIWVVGDSTASVYASTLYPRTGWAQPLQGYYAPACATVNDRALSGRSSKSFVDEGAWAPVRDALRAGDFVLIQFGHNDEKAEDPLRFTDPATTFRDYLSIYIDDTLAHGATPVLLTPIQRNNWTGAALRDTHGAYPDAIRQLARARNVALVDATALTTEYFERIGTAAATELFMNLAVGQFPNYPDGNADNTHLREEGAHAVARLILTDLARQGSPLGRLVLSVPVSP